MLPDQKFFFKSNYILKLGSARRAFRLAQYKLAKKQLINVGKGLLEAVTKGEKAYDSAGIFQLVNKPKFLSIRGADIKTSISELEKQLNTKVLLNPKSDPEFIKSLDKLYKYVDDAPVSAATNAAKRPFWRRAAGTAGLFGAGVGLGAAPFALSHYLGGGAGGGGGYSAGSALYPLLGILSSPLHAAGVGALGGLGLSLLSGDSSNMLRNALIGGIVGGATSYLLPYLLG